MAEPLKNLFDEDAIRGMAGHLARVDSSFDTKKFVAYASDGLAGLELKQRSSRITDALELCLPDDFTAAVRHLVDSLDLRTHWSTEQMDERGNGRGIAGWPVMPMADFVARRGQANVELSLDALREMTMRSTSEFAIRDFIVNHPDVTLATMKNWCIDDNEHVRRLASEGSRPRLPWGMQLREFVADPTPVLPLLELLKDDPSEYVRRSVANNLNDIAKDHPDLVVDITQRWMNGATPERERLVRHALRTLVKAGHRGALEVLGYGAPKLTLTRFDVLTAEVTLGEALEFEVELESTAATAQALIIDYVVHHVKANGSTSAKAFKWKNITLKSGESVAAKRRHPMRPITTRRYYPGEHRVELQINGKTFDGVAFTLKVPSDQSPT